MEVKMMELAIKEAEKCTPILSAYNVGAIICDQDFNVLSYGYNEKWFE